MRLAMGLTTLAATTLALACAEAPADPAGPISTERAQQSDNGPVYVLNTQLRPNVGYGGPDASPPWGHAQLKLTDDGEAGYRVVWSGKLFNPDQDAFSSGFIINPDILPAPGDDELPVGVDPVFTLFDEASLTCGIVTFDSDDSDSQHLSTEAAMALIEAPETHAIVVVSDAGLVRGQFGVVDPTTLIGFETPPDPPGKVRCET